MFTGIVQEVGKLVSIRHESLNARVEIHAPDICHDAMLGDSICCNGVCLTVTDLKDNGFWADLSTETLARSTFAHAKTGDSINLEPALRPTDRMGGHIMTGHVDAIGAIEAIEAGGESWSLFVSFPEHLGRYIAEKGSLSVDGMSLTVASVEQVSARFAIIPFTMEHTNLKDKRPGAPVNLEVDILARYIERLLSFTPGNRDSGLSWEKLREYGYLNE